MYKRYVIKVTVMCCVPTISLSVQLYIPPHFWCCLFGTKESQYDSFFLCGHFSSFFLCLKFPWPKSRQIQCSSFLSPIDLLSLTRLILPFSCRMRPFKLPPTTHLFYGVTPLPLTNIKREWILKFIQHWFVINFLANFITFIFFTFS